MKMLLAWLLHEIRDEDIDMLFESGACLRSIIKDRDADLNLGIMSSWLD